MYGTVDFCLKCSIAISRMQFVARMIPSKQWSATVAAGINQISTNEKETIQQ